MSIHFDRERMEKARSAYMRWWRGELDRPLMRLTLTDAYPRAHAARAPLLTQATCAELAWSPEQVIEALEEELSQYEFLGDAFPSVSLDSFGPGVLAAFCGARLENASGGVWFFAEEPKALGELHARYDPDNVWARRIKALCRAGWERWQGLVVMGMPDLGGVLDVAATLRGSENLLLDLYDEPEEVKRLCGEIQTAWYAAYEDIRAAMGSKNGYTDWSGLLCDEPSYILQSDFSYMISNEMFREFVLETLRADTQRLAHTIYHMDGVGELKHLDSLLSLEGLDAVQWVYGDGQPKGVRWLDVYRRIQAGGKRMMIVDGPEDFLAVLAEVHGAPYTTQWLRTRDRALAKRLLEAR